MKKAKVFVYKKQAGVLYEVEKGKNYIFEYLEHYQSEAISLSMPVKKRRFEFNRFPPFFDGLLPEGSLLEGLLKNKKIDEDDFFAQLIATGEDLVGAVTVQKYGV